MKNRSSLECRVWNEKKKKNSYEREGERKRGINGSQGMAIQYFEDVSRKKKEWRISIFTGSPNLTLSTRESSFSGES